jgi:acyl carrier protein
MTDIQSFIVARLEENSPLPGDSEESKFAYDYLDQGHIDSFGIMQLILSVEEHFDVRLGQEDLQSDEIRTVGGLAEVVARHVRAKGR